MKVVDKVKTAQEVMLFFAVRKTYSSKVLSLNSYLQITGMRMLSNDS